MPKAYSGSPRSRGEDKAEEMSEDIMVENFLKLTSEINSVTWEAQQNLRKINIKNITLRDIIDKLLKTKDKILKTGKKKRIYYTQGDNFSPETMKVKGQKNKIFKLLKEKNSQHRILCAEKITFKTKGEIKKDISDR